MYKFFGITNNGSAIPVILLILSLAVFCITLSLAIPQLIHSIKAKKTHRDTKFYSFWLFYAGLLGWIILGGFGTAKLGASVYANTICVFIYSVVLYFLYKDSWGKRIKAALYILISTLTVNAVVVVLSILGLYGVIGSFNDAGQNVAGLIVPLLTTFAFLPQILKGFETKNFGSMSIGMVMLFVINNIGWILYFTFAIINGDPLASLLSPIVFQTLSLIIYSSQLSLMIRMRRSRKEKHQNV
ncbi:PQ-loop domain-containing transporter [Mycoplasmopsis iners]|uniref:PQ-loop domain-containing transporter n=1 Tax=Mycoplasmopsis iners TaxID=76630 RepID=UPI00068D0C87|nr:PQ-loop domain-containing transporter [Mycoplasmopsis iners]